MKKILALLLSVVMILSALPMVFVSAAEGYFEGAGTEEDPYLIQTPEDLATLVYLTTDYDNGYFNTTEDYPIPDTDKVWPAAGAFGVSGYYSGRYNGVSPIRYYKMTADLDMTGYDFNRGGICAGSDLEFRGSFDGDGHVIKNWKSSTKGTKLTNGIFTQAGFGNVSGQGVRNLGIENASVTSGANTSAVLVGWINVLGDVDNVAVENCYVRDSESTIVTRVDSEAQCQYPTNAGVVGCVRYNTNDADTKLAFAIKNCYVRNLTLTQDGTTSRYGEFAGVVSRTWINWNNSNIRINVENCYSVGDEAADSLSVISTEVKGTDGFCTFTDCYNIDANGSATWKNHGTQETGLAAPTAETLGEAFSADKYNLNSGYPVLKWEVDRIDNAEPSKITLSMNEGGSVKFEGANLSDGEEFEAKIGVATELEIEIDRGYDAEVLFDGNKVLYSNGKFSITPSKANHTLTVTFKEVPKISANFYVDPVSGSDSNSGDSKEQAFASIDKAKTVIAKYIQIGAFEDSADINVYIKGGEYKTDSSISFAKDNSGTAEQEIIYQPYEGETVTFTGADKLDSSKIQKVTDENLLNRLSESYAKDHLYMLDLKAQGIALPALRSNTATNGQRIYMNGVALTNARWPNADKTGEQYYVRGETGTLTAEQEGKYNGGGQPAVLKYSDPDNRTATWQIKQNDLFLCGAIAYLWYPETVLIDTIDVASKKVVTLGKAAYGQDTYTAKTERYLYFENVFEEIDQPGESYLDRDTGILYFYPVGKVSGAELCISKTSSDLLAVNGASYITFKDIDFKNAIGNAISINADNITVDGSEISGIGGNGIAANGSDITVKNCNIYDFASHGVDLGGGDRKTLEPSGNVITNNKIHSGYGMLSRGISASGAGHEISHNDIFDFTQEAIRYNNLNNTVIEYNEIYDVQLLNADGGAIYAGRNCSDLGNIVRYNYFHDIGAHIGHHGQQAVFTDDGEVGPAIYGNIIYKGGLPDYPLKTHGGQFHQIYNNILIDNNVGFYMQAWNNSANGVKNDMIPARWFLYMTDMGAVYGIGGSNLFSSRKDLVLSDEWRKYYTETESTKYWAKVFDFLNAENYSKAKEFSDNGDAAGFTAWMEENLPEGNTNFVYNNVLIDIGSLGSGWGEFKNNLEVSSKSASAWFADYGSDFTLNDDGLAEIQKTIPTFERTDFSKIGVQGENAEKPAITGASILGNAAVGKTLSANYNYSGSNSEGATEVFWYYANSKNGTYKRITDGYGKYFTVGSEYENKYIRFEAVPKDVKYTSGEKAVSDSVYIDPDASSVDKDALWALIEKVTKTLDDAVVGTEGGQYDQETKDALAAARDKALETANNANAYQYQVTEAENELQAALDLFTKSVNDLLSTLGVERISLKSLLDDEDGWINSTGDELKFENGALIIGNGNATLAEYTAKKFGKTQFSFKMKPEIIDPSAENAADAWVGIYLRQQQNGWCWNGGNGAAMFDLKQQLIQYQQHPKPLTWSAAINPDLVLSDKKLEMGKAYDVTVGVYETKTDGEMLVELTLNGEKIYMDTISGTEMSGTEGMFAISAGANTKLTVYAAQADFSELNEEIAAAESFVSGAKTGNGYGEYAKDAIDELNSEIAAAKIVAADENTVQFDADKAAVALRKALNTAKDSFNRAGTVGENVTINYAGEKAELTVPDDISKVTVNTEKDKVLPDFSAKSKDFEMKADEGAIPGGSFNLPVKGTQPSADFKLGDFSGAYGEGYAEFSKPVRIVLYGEGGKQAAYKNENGKYVQITRTIREDSFSAAQTALSDGKTAAVRFVSGSDLVIYTTVVSEFITYTKSASEDNSGSSGGGNSGTVTTNPYGGNKGSGTTGNGFYSTDTSNPNIDNPFTDMVNHWAAADVVALNKIGVVSGVSETLFDPDRNITRAEFAAIIARALKLEDKTADFKDVNGEWFAPFVGACADAGIITGYDGYFRPSDNITRQEMAVIIVNAYSYLEKTGASGGIDNFTDKAEIADWAKAAVDTASSVGLISGMGDGTFAPGENATRAQAASIVKRLLDK